MGEMKRIRVFKTDDKYKKVANAVQGFTINGLNGNVDGVYEINLKIATPTNSNSRGLIIKPNGDSGNGTSRKLEVRSDGNVSEYSDGKISLASFKANQEGDLGGSWKFFAEVDGRDRVIIGHTDSFRGDDVLMVIVGGRYTEKNTNITSLWIGVETGLIYGKITVDKFIEA